MTKKLIFIAVMIGSFLTYPLLNAAAEDVTGDCGDDIVWTLDDSGVLSITGSGDMYDWESYDDSPFYEYSQNISSINIADGVTSIGKYAFYNCRYISEINIPESVTYIGKDAFNSQSNMIVIRGSISIPDSIDIPESGLDIRLSIATRRGGSSGGGGGGGFDLGYPGEPFRIPENTWPEEKKYDTIIKTTTVHIPHEKNSVDFCIWTTTNSNTYSRSIWFVYDIISDGYHGNGQIYTDNDSDMDITAECIKTSVIRGRITVPPSWTDLGLTVTAEGNRQFLQDPYGYYYTTRDFAATEQFTADYSYVDGLPCIYEYSLVVPSDTDYDVYVNFDDKRYAMQTQSLHVGQDEVTVDFDAFSSSKAVTGSLVIPDDITFSSDTNYLMGEVVLQSAEPPYYILDTYSFTVTPDVGTIPFTLYDNMSVNNSILFFYIYGTHNREYYTDISGIFTGGYYRDAAPIACDLEDATHFTPDNRHVTISLSKADTIPVSAYVSNNSDQDMTASKYIVFIGENGKYIRSRKSSLKIGAHETASVFDHISEEEYNDTDIKSIYMLIWGENMKPLKNKMYIK